MMVHGGSKSHRQKVLSTVGPKTGQRCRPFTTRSTHRPLVIQPHLQRAPPALVSDVPPQMAQQLVSPLRSWSHSTHLLLAGNHLGKGARAS